MAQVVIRQRGKISPYVSVGFGNDGLQDEPFSMTHIICVTFKRHTRSPVSPLLTDSAKSRGGGLEGCCDFQLHMVLIQRFSDASLSG